VSQLPSGPLHFPAHLTDDWVEEYRSNRWLGLGDTSKIPVINPFDTRTDEDIENPHVFLLDLMRRPENFGFTCKILFGKTLAPFQLAILRELWVRPFPMLLGSRGMGKSWLLAVYIMLRALFNQGSKVVICGAAFRQAKVVFDYCQALWEDGPVLRDIVGSDKKNGPRRDVDRCSLRMGDSIIVALPLGDGTKIRGQRANIIVCDEFASVPRDIFETVVRGFAAVSLDPVAQYQQEMKRVALKELGLWTDAHEALEESALLSNQTVISGTAYYAFNHFYEYWQQYKAIIESRGDPRKTSELFGGKIPSGHNWKDYVVIRVPVEKLPPKFMDEKSIAQAKATVHTGIYQMEYGAVFATDSNGFFKRSLIESCVVGRPTRGDEDLPAWWDRFKPALKGPPGRTYVMALDPASERDNLSVVVLECWPTHRRVVFCWTVNRARHKAKLKRGLVSEENYYVYAARKVRDLMVDFPTVRLAIDSQGGGIPILEALADKGNLKPGERPLYPAVDPDKPRPTDDLHGDHIIDVVEFSQGSWVSEANHGLRKDMEVRELLFPEFDTALLALSHEEDKEAGRVRVDSSDMTVEKLYDTLEDCVLEIEELKTELTTIVHTQTGTSMRDRWDTPEVKQAGGKKGRLRKDRYSALLMANMSARTLARTPAAPEYRPVGGFARNIAAGGKRDRKDGPMFVGPAWWAGAGAGYGAVGRR
jgi:hypothetical protein